MSSASSRAMPCAWRRSAPFAREPLDPFVPTPEVWCAVMRSFWRRGRLVLGTGYLYTKQLCQSQTNPGTHGDQDHPSLSITWWRGKVHVVKYQTAPGPSRPRYGTRSLGELVPSLLSSLGASGFANELAIEPAARICLLLVDGLGWELMQANSGAAPFLSSIGREPLTTGFPATTAASLTSLATGVPPGEHGLVGYTMALPGYDRAFNTLTWSLYGVGPRVELVNEVVPEAFQPIPTLAERSAIAGLRIHHLGPAFHEWSGLTRAIGRGERFHSADSLEAGAEGALRLMNAPRAFVFGYHPRLDAAGHVHGVASQAWKDELVAVDQAVRALSEQLPADTLLVISGDHGMVGLRPEERLDLADHPDLAAGVRILGGEARARYVGTQPGVTGDGRSAR